MGNRPSLIVAMALLGLILILVSNASPSLAQHATPEPAAPVAITSEVLGHALPVTVENPELALGRVTVMPGAVLPVHYHPGTQIGVVVQGELTYTVFTGEINWYRGDDPTGEPHTDPPGGNRGRATRRCIGRVPRFDPSGAQRQHCSAGDLPVYLIPGRRSAGNRRRGDPGPVKSP